MNGRQYRVALESVWDSSKKRPYSRQVVLGPAEPPPEADLARTSVVGRRRLGDVGALLWVAEQLDVVRIIDTACGATVSPKAPTLGEMALAVAVQRACHPAAKKHLNAFLEESLPRVACLPSTAFSGQRFHWLAERAGAAQLEQAQIALARAATGRFDLKTNVLAFDSTNFDTFIDTRTKSELAQRGHAKSKRHDLRVVGLAVLASETGHVPLLHRTYAGNQSDQGVLADCLSGLQDLHTALGADTCKSTGTRTVVRDGGFWSPQLELELEHAGYGNLVSLPLQHTAARQALQAAAAKGKMKPLKGSLSDVRAARLENQVVGASHRTLVVVESKELLQGQKRGIAVALRKAGRELAGLARRAAQGRFEPAALAAKVKKALAREHLADFVWTHIDQAAGSLRLSWGIDAQKRKALERERLGKRVLCTNRSSWSTERIVWAFRGQWNVEEIFRRSKRGGVVAWGPSHQWADASLRLHTFATVLGLMLVALARMALGTKLSAKAMMTALAGIEATQVRISTGQAGRRPTTMLVPDLTPLQKRAVKTFSLGVWWPSIDSTRSTRAKKPANAQAA